MRGDDIAAYVSPDLAKTLDNKAIRPDSVADLMRILQIYGKEQKSIFIKSTRQAGQELNIIAVKFFSSAA